MTWFGWLSVVLFTLGVIAPGTDRAGRILLFFMALCTLFVGTGYGI